MDAVSHCMYAYMWEHERKAALTVYFGALSELSFYEREGEGTEEGKVRSGDLEGREMETDEKGSPGAEVTLRTRC